MFRNRVLAAGIAGLAAGLAVPAINGNAQEGETAITCTNPVSGTSWQIVIDYRKPTVDSNPAKITPGGISWFDPRTAATTRSTANPAIFGRASRRAPGLFSTGSLQPR